MKTTRKGFTLIELIVVIAIIGVLAAILVPAMLGYVKKSKIQAGNADAKSMLTIANTVLEEADEMGIDVTVDGWFNSTKWNDDTDTDTDAESWGEDEILAAMNDYSDTAVSAKFAIYIKDGMGVLAAAKSGKYYGTYPAVLTNKNYDDLMESNDADSAKSVAEEAYKKAHGEDSLASEENDG